MTGAGTFVLDADHGNANYGAAPQVQQTLVVTPANTTTTLASSANPAVPGQSVTFTAVIAAVAPGGGTPTGTVNFTSDGTTLQPGDLLGRGRQFAGVRDPSYASAGTPAIMATYHELGRQLHGRLRLDDADHPRVRGLGLRDTLYLVGGSTSSDTVSVKPAGSKTDGTTGLAVSATLNDVSSRRPSPSRSRRSSSPATRATRPSRSRPP